jgi:hypothetical protein
MFEYSFGLNCLNHHFETGNVKKKTDLLLTEANTAAARLGNPTGHGKTWEHHL